MPEPIDRSGLLSHTYIKLSDDSSPRNDTANVVEVADGRLMVAWHRYNAGPEGASDFGLATIAGAFSSDDGATWHDERLLVDVVKGDLNVQAPALALLPSGDLLLACNRAHSKSSTSMLLYRSSDGGMSFSYDRAIWEHSDGQMLQGGAASLLRLANGRLILPFHGGTGDQWGQHNRIWCYYSDDEGATWNIGPGAIDLPMRGAMEPSVAELPTGELIMSIRTQLGAVFISRSNDGGEHFSLACASNLKSPESCTCLRLIPGTNNLALFWNDSLYDPTHHHYGIRTPLSCAISNDGGTTFQKIGDVDGGDTMLTNLNCTFLASGTAIVTYLHVDDAEVIDGKYQSFKRSPWHSHHVGLKCAQIDREWFDLDE